MFTALNRDDCIFCRIVDGKENNEILYEDDEVVVFEDINPAAKIHLLAIPKMHIRNCFEFISNQVGLLDKLKIGGDVALRRILMDSNDSEHAYQKLIGFHMPPHNSVYHLHMHIIPYNETCKYKPERVFGPDNDWFITYDEVREQLGSLVSSAIIEKPVLCPLPQTKQTSKATEKSTVTKGNRKKIKRLLKAILKSIDKKSRRKLTKKKVPLQIIFQTKL